MMDNDNNDQNNRDRSRRSDRGRNNSRFSNDRDRSRDRDRDRSDCRRIYVSNVPYEYRWQDLKDLFRKEVGDVSFVELFHDESNKPRGCGIVEFEKAEHVQMALDKMNRFDINGRQLVIKEDYGNERDKYGRVVPKSFRGERDGDNRRRDRDDDRISGRDDGGGFNPDFNTYGLSIKFLEGLGIQGPLHTRIFIANLDYKVDAKKLKQVFKLAGKVQNVDLSVDKDGNSRGFAVIEYDHPVEAVQAISMFDRQMLFDRRMTVRLDRVPEKGELNRLPEGLKGIGIGLGPNGEPLKDVARNLPSLQQNNQIQNNPIQNSAPTPVQPPLGGNLLSAASSNLSGLNSNLAAQLSNVVGLSTLTGNLQSSLLSNAAAGLSNLTGLGNLGGGGGGSGLGGLGGSGGSGLAGLGSLGGGGGGGNDGGLGGGLGSGLGGGNFNQNYSSGGFGNNGGGNRGNDYDMGSSNVRNYSTAPNDDYGRNYGNINNGNRKISDTIIIRNMPSAWTWQTLRDKFRDVGEVKFAEIRGQDTGVVRFAKERDAEVAIKIMDGSRFEGRTVDVNFF
ncbi:heterogeneous nuclear ribonucleoprotein M [Toxorhynchites rutilus septentrionalis]|uniref:heterogeneous nuclear ribonucleoprotein M n=1 Tax=Toxorhynchites rutilus septentrionalis TaxID=329112 RepID=UPI00247A3B81|nr:heterogeneous nuclear ribonucleoprotein M [Toxorhynchites rutilus septentrionalis]